MNETGSQPRLKVGSGEKFFVAGGDLKELISVKEDNETEAMAMNGRAMLDQIRYFPVPVIANINGYALGGGAELAMACDYRIASKNAKFGLKKTILVTEPFHYKRSLLIAKKLDLNLEPYYHKTFFNNSILNQYQNYSFSKNWENFDIFMFELLGILRVFLLKI